MNFRIGQGWDIHRLVPGRPLVLGGVVVPSELGELGHSDGDVLFHAVTDALLGALALGDIGRHFPPSDQRWKDADSRLFAERAASMVAEAGYRIVNIDSTVTLESPRLAPFVDAIRASLASALGVPVGAVSVKAKTREGLGDVGRREAVEASAAALVESAGDGGAAGGAGAVGDALARGGAVGGSEAAGEVSAPGGATSSGDIPATGPRGEAARGEGGGRRELGAMRYRHLETDELEAAKELIREYVRSLRADISYQGVDDELDSFPAKYAEPRGAFIVADDGPSLAGCVGMRPLVDGACEMKRLYVRDAYKGRGVGRALASKLIDEARAKGYRAMRLDTLSSMSAAVALYRSLGFVEIDGYIENPLDGAMFMEKRLA